MDGARERGRTVLALLCVAQFIDVLGVAVVVVALPAIAADLGTGDRSAEWLITAYALCFGGLLLLCGRAADLYGRRRLFVSGLLVFAAASVACGVAPSSAVLLGARAVQGAAAAMVVPAALSLLTAAFPAGPGRTRALGVWTAAAAGGGSAGFLVGGVVTAAAGWRWVFLLNVPVALVTAAGARWVLTESRGTVAGRLDVSGAVLVTLGLGATIAGLTLLADGGAAAIPALVCGAALLAGFLALQARRPDPLMPLPMLRRPHLAGAGMVAVVLTATTSGAGVLATVHLQDTLGQSPAATGLLFLPFTVLVAAASLAGPRLVSALGTRRAIVLGLGTVAAGMLTLLGATADTGVAPVAVALGVAGAGLGIASVAATSIGMAAASGAEQGLAAGMLNTATQLGTATGVAVLGAIAGVGGVHAGWLAAAVAAAVAALGVAAARRRPADAAHRTGPAPDPCGTPPPRQAPSR